MGRAGRSGEEGWCHLFLCNTDFLRLRSLGHAEGIDCCQVEALLEEVFQTDYTSFSGRKRQGLEPQGSYGVLGIPQLGSRLDTKEEVLETVLSYVEV